MNDCVVSLFCNRCILMQMDREMRARDSQIKLRTCSEYKRKTKTTNHQPVPNQEMRYMSAEEFCPGNPASDLVSRRRPPQARLPTGIKKQTKVLTRQHQLKEVLNASGVDQVRSKSLSFQVHQYNSCNKTDTRY